MSRYEEFYRQSVDAPEAFWAEQAKLIDWQAPAQQILDASQPPFARWFVGGTTNLCHNAIDRHLAARGDQPALIFVSTETGVEKSYSFTELHAEVQRTRRQPCRAGCGQGRPRADLHADDSRGRLCHAGLRAHRRDPLRGVRRLRERLAGHAHRRRRAQGDRQRRRRLARRQGHRLQAAARRGDPAVEAQAFGGAADRPRSRADGPDGGS